MKIPISPGSPTSRSNPPEAVRPEVVILPPLQEQTLGEVPSALPWPAPPPPAPRWRLPLALFIVTCLSTWAVSGLTYAFGVMLTLGAHELGHYFVARRYRMAASLPYFLPMPISPIGTMGAVIVMPSRISNVKALFDMAISLLDIEFKTLVQ